MDDTGTETRSTTRFIHAVTPGRPRWYSHIISFGGSGCLSRGFGNKTSACVKPCPGSLASLKILWSAGPCETNRAKPVAPAATQLQFNCNSTATELQLNCNSTKINRPATELQQNCNSTATQQKSTELQLNCNSTKVDRTATQLQLDCNSTKANKLIYQTTRHEE